MQRFLLLLIFASTPLAASNILSVTQGTMHVSAGAVNPSWSLDVSGHGFALVASGLWMAPGVNSECVGGCEPGQAADMDVHGSMYSPDVQLTLNGRHYGTGALGQVDVSAAPASAGAETPVQFSIDNWKFSVYASLNDVAPHPVLQDILLRGSGTAAVDWTYFKHGDETRVDYLGATYTFHSVGSEGMPAVAEPGTFGLLICALGLLAFIRFVPVRILRAGADLPPQDL